MQDFGKPAFGGDEGRVTLHPERQRVERPVIGGQNRRGIGAGIHFAPEDRGDQVGALRKVAVERADANAGLFGDLAHRRIDA